MLYDKNKLIIEVYCYQISSDFLMQQLNFCTKLRIYFDIGCFNILGDTLTSNSKLIYPSK